MYIRKIIIFLIILSILPVNIFAFECKYNVNTSPIDAIILYDNIPVFENNQMNANIIKYLNTDNIIELLEIENIWIKIKYDDIEGYIIPIIVALDSEKYAAPVFKIIVDRKPASFKGFPKVEHDYAEELLNYAYQFLGTPYVWGGTTPAGFDCSGFVQYIFAGCGYEIYRTATAQMDNGTPVPQSDLKPGDLIFFERTYNTDGASHVGIYIGDSEFIHCAGSVKITSLEEEYYSSRYYGAVRIIPE